MNNERRVAKPLSFLQEQAILSVIMGTPGIKEQIEKIIINVAGDLGYMIYESGIYFKGINSRVIVKIDHLEGITHSNCEQFSKELTFRLDEANILPNYSLEVSSPGIKRSLRNLEDYKRFTGAPAKFICSVDTENKVYIGKIISVEDESIKLETESGPVTLPCDSIVRANLNY